MARDKRDPRRRSKSTRLPRPKTLVLCEGETEVTYFEAMRKVLRISPEILTIKTAGGTQPQQIVDEAISLCAKNKSDWDHIFCVFDTDVGPVTNAMQSCQAQDRKYKNNAKEKIRFTAIPSWPCFEIWILNHFERVTRELECAQVIERIRHAPFIRDYEKNDVALFSKTSHLLSDAIGNTAEQHANSIRQGVDNPSTQIVPLIHHIHNMRSEFASALFE